MVNPLSVPGTDHHSPEEGSGGIVRMSLPARRQKQNLFFAPGFTQQMIGRQQSADDGSALEPSPRIGGMSLSISRRKGGISLPAPAKGFPA